MKCALHVHTTMSDAHLEPEEAVGLYAEKGFGAIAFTDHEFLLHDDYVETIRSLDPMGMMVLIGIEVDYEPWWYQHLLRIQGDRETLHVLAHPSSYYLELDEVINKLDSEPFPIDAVEITHRGFYTPTYDDPKIKVPKIATDDAHHKQDVGRAWIETEGAKDPDQLIRAVKAGDFQSHFIGNKNFRR